MFKLIFFLALLVDAVHVVGGWEGFLTPWTFGWDPLIFPLRRCYGFTGFIFHGWIVLKTFTIFVVNCFSVSFASLHRSKNVFVGWRSGCDELVFCSRFCLEHIHWFFLIFFPLIHQVDHLRIYFLQNLWNSLAKDIISALLEQPWLTIIILMITIHNMGNELHLERDIGENQHQRFQMINLWLFILGTVPQCLLAELIFLVGP